MGLAPLQQFICDKCGQVIEKVDDGWLEWFDDCKTPAHGFRIVHAGGPCIYRDSADVSDNHLFHFTGPDGLADLLSFFDREHGVNQGELAEIIRRLHVPYYEEARQYLDRAVNDGYLGGKESIRQNDLKGIIEEYCQD